MIGMLKASQVRMNRAAFSEAIAAGLGVSLVNLLSEQGAGHVDATLARIGRKRTIQMRVQHYLVAPLIAQRTDLALTAPVSLLRRHEGRILELPFEVAPLEWHCYWHRSLDQDQANQWLRDKFIATMRSAQNGQ